MRSMLGIVALLLLGLIGCVGATSELVFGVEAPEQQNSVAYTHLGSSDLNFVGGESGNIQTTLKVGSARRGVAARTLVSRYYQRSRRLQQLNSLYSLEKNPYITGSEDSTAPYTASQQDRITSKDQGQPVPDALLSPTQEDGKTAAAALVQHYQSQEQTDPMVSVVIQQPESPAAPTIQASVHLADQGLVTADDAVQTRGTRHTKRRRRSTVIPAPLTAADTITSAAGLIHKAPEAVLSVQPMLPVLAVSAPSAVEYPAWVWSPGTLEQVEPQVLSPSPIPSPIPSPSPSPSSSPSPSVAQQAKYCIPATRGMQFNVLAAGDSITQGSVPSKMINHPYTIELSALLRQRIGKNADATDAGLGGGGIFMDGFNNPVKFPPYYQSYLGQVEWNVVVITIGINDLLRGGYPAADIMAGLQPLYDQTLAKGIPVIAIPPFAAPGFVSQTDSKEAERKKLADLIADAAAKHQAATGGKGPQITVLDLQGGPLDFWKMTDTERKQYLDDGLHLTESAYDQLGQYVYDAVNGLLCSVQNPTITIPLPDPKLILKP